MSSSEVQLPGLEHFTPLTQPTKLYTEYAEGVRRSQEASGSNKKHTGYTSQGSLTYPGPSAAFDLTGPSISFLHSLTHSLDLKIYRF